MKLDCRWCGVWGPSRASECEVWVPVVLWAVVCLHVETFHKRGDLVNENMYTYADSGDLVRFLKWSRNLAFCPLRDSIWSVKERWIRADDKQITKKVVKCKIVRLPCPALPRTSYTSILQNTDFTPASFPFCVSLTIPLIFVIEPLKLHFIWPCPEWVSGRERVVVY